MTTVMSVEHMIGNRHSHDKENIKSPLHIYASWFQGLCTCII